MHRYLYIILSLFPLMGNAAVPPVIVTTIKPVYALVSAVSDGIISPRLLVDGRNSPHSYQLKPSDVKKIHEADMIFFVDHKLEFFLEKTLQTLKAETIQVELSGIDGIKLLPVRNREHEHQHHTEHNTDMHIWLNPDNARKIVRHTAAILAEADPKHADVYFANQAEFLTELDKTSQVINEKLSPYHNTKFIVFHDAYQYFEDFYQLNSFGNIVNLPHDALSANKIHKLTKDIEYNNIKCLFAEPQALDSFVSAISNATNTKLYYLDPLGAEIKAGKKAYFDILNNITDNLINCFENGQF